MAIKIVRLHSKNRLWTIIALLLALIVLVADGVARKYATQALRDSVESVSNMGARR